MSREIADSQASRPYAAETVGPPAGVSWSTRLRWLMGSPLGAALGALCYGLWAVYANRDGGSAIALRAGLMHWAISAGLTYSGAGSMRLMFQAIGASVAGALAAFFGGLAFTYSVLIGAHTLNGSPHILLTLAPGLLPTVLFCATYSLLLLRTQPLRHDDIALGA